MGVRAWWRRLLRNRSSRVAEAEAAAFAAQRAAERRARALVELARLRTDLEDAAARCDAYLDGEAEGIGEPEPVWAPYAGASADVFGARREDYVVVAAACRGMQTVAAEPSPERVEPVRHMIGAALNVLGAALGDGQGAGVHRGEGGAGGGIAE